jgi:hypothetical protein
VFRNSLPPLFQDFDFADTSVSVGQRSRSTVATQALAMLNHPWVIDRARHAARRWASVWQGETVDDAVQSLYVICFGRSPDPREHEACVQFLAKSDAPGHNDADHKCRFDQANSDRLETLIHSLFASVDFRFLE